MVIVSTWQLRLYLAGKGNKIMRCLLFVAILGGTLIVYGGCNKDDADSSPAENKQSTDRTGAAPTTTKPRSSSKNQPLVPEKLFARISPAVVRVIVYNRESEPLGCGSGFFVTTSGMLVTNYHVIKQAYSAKARLNNGAEIPIQGTIALDSGVDLAILKVNGRHLPFLEVASGTLPQIGTKVYAIGNPKGLTNTLSEGLVSGHREVNKRLTLIQTTAAMSPGSSGGPLLGTNGQVVGVTSASFSDGQNLNFAIPAANIRDLMRAPQSLQKLPVQASLPSKPGGEPKTHQLPSSAPGVTQLLTRLKALATLEAELVGAIKTTKSRHPKILRLRKDLLALALSLDRDVLSKIAKLEAADAKQAEALRAQHPRRLAIQRDIAKLKKARSGILTRWRTDFGFWIEVAKCATRASNGAADKRYGTSDFGRELARMESLRKKVDLYCRIAKLQAKLGDKVGALASLKLARAVPDHIILDGRRRRACMEIAKTQADIGDFAGAEAVVMSSPGTVGDKWPTYLHIITAAARADEVATAKSLAEKFQGVERPLAADAVIAEIQAKAGDKPAALETLKLSVMLVDYAVKDLGAKADAYAVIAKTYGKIGERPAALQRLLLARQCAKRIQDSSSKAKAHLVLAKVYAEIGDKARALELAKFAQQLAARFTKTSDRISLYLEIAALRTEVGDGHGAAEALRSAYSVAKEVEREGRGIRVAKGPRLLNNVSAVYEDISKMLAGLGEIADAKSAANRIDTVYAKLRAYRSIAESQLKNGDTQRIATTLRRMKLLTTKADSEAKKHPLHKPGNFSRIDSYCTIVEIQAKAGNLAGARATVLEIPRDDRARAYCLIAVARSKLEDKPGATKAVQSAKSAVSEIQDRSKKAFAHDLVAGARYKLGDKPGAIKALQSAKSTASEIQDPDEQAFAYFFIASRLQSIVGDEPGAAAAWQLAMSTAAKMKNTYAKELRYGGIAFAIMRSSGRLSQIETWIDDAHPPVVKASACIMALELALSGDARAQDEPRDSAPE